MTEVEQFGDDEAVMWKLYVQQTYHGQGIGDRLLQAINDRLPPQVRQRKTEYYDSNILAAQFYKAKGFTFLERKQEHFEKHVILYTYVSKSLDRRFAE